LIEASAPGRVNLIGEHTDYNGGFVLPMAIPQRTYVELHKTSGNAVRAESEGMPPAQFMLGSERKTSQWVDYVQGVTWVLAREGLNVGGCDLRIRSEVPHGGGLSSSAALCVAVLRALRLAFELPIDDVRIALLAQEVENDFVGAPVGVMDQMASSLADERTALFLDTRSLRHERVPLPEDLGVIVINSGIRHSHATGDYRTRRAECEEAARLLGVPQLRDATDHAAIERLPELLRRRARHVVSEDARVQAAVKALAAGDAGTLGKLFVQSHASMRDDFEVSIPEIDRLVETALDTQGVFGARLTGGGFGGSIVALAQISESTDVGKRIISKASRTGLRPSLLVPAPRH
jgi:galactokinase